MESPLTRAALKIFINQQVERNGNRFEFEVC